MSEPTAAVNMPVRELKAGMRCVFFEGQTPVEIDDIIELDSTGRVRLTWTEGRTQASIRLQSDVLVEAHYTLDEAVKAFYGLSREESDAYQRALDLSNKRSDMARLAQKLGWRG